MTTPLAVPPPPSRPPLGPLARQVALRVLLGFPAMMALVFLPAGTVRWPAGWLFLAGLLGCVVCNWSVLLLANPDVVSVRLSRHADVPVWDRWVTGVAGVGALGLFVVAGLDFRWGSTRPWPMLWQWVGVAVLVTGNLLALSAMAVNRFFAKDVAIQTESDHQVVSRGPYRLVRHPGYVGFSLFCLAIPLILASAWAFAPAMLVVAGLVLRTALEDAFLLTQLPGYREYAARVRSRLVPGVW